MILGVGFLLLVSLTVSAFISGLTQFIGSRFGGDATIAHLLDILISFGFITLLFAMIYKFLPDVEIQWQDVWTGAALTSILFTIGKFLIGLYLGSSGITSIYGAAGSLITVILWVYYSSLIFLLGAEFTEVYATPTDQEWFQRKMPKASPLQATAKHKPGLGRSDEPRTTDVPGAL